MSSGESSLDTPYWNLAQAAAWVVMRSIGYVDKFGGLSPDSWSATLMYGETWPYPVVGEESELLKALRKGNLMAFGVRARDPQGLEEIPSADWEVLTISPPEAYYDGPQQSRIRPWLEIKVKSADLWRLWPGPDAPSPPKEKHSRKNWGAVDAEIRRIKSGGVLDLADLSDRQLTERIVSALGKAYRDDPKMPKERSIRSYISKMRKTGDLPSRRPSDSD